MGSRRNTTLIVALSVLLVWGSAEAKTLQELGRVTAKAAIVVDARTGQVFFARNPNLQLPPASTTKVLTALAALRSGSLERNFSVSKYASSMEPSKIWLKSGWTVKMEDLLYAVLLNSANDASVVLAEGVAGSVSKFAQMMNETARSIGASRSNFVNPNGLPDRGHVSTVFDLAEIMRYAARVPEMRRILETQTRVMVPNSGSRRPIRLRSHNRLLTRKEVPVIGKTGYTRAAKRCFVGLASDGNREVVVAMLGSNKLWPDVERLVAYGIQQGATADTIPAAQWQEASAAHSRREAWPKRPLGTDVPHNIDAWEQAAIPQANTRPERSTAPSLRQAEVSDDGGGFRYHVQLASFRSRARADRLTGRVKGYGYTASVERSGRGKRLFYRVTVRDFSTRAAARKVAQVLGQDLQLEPLILAART